MRDAALFPEENPNPVLRTARDGTLLYANPSSAGLLKTWGCQPGEAVPKHIQVQVRRALELGQVVECEEPFENKVLSFFITPIESRDCANLYSRDITRRKQVELDLVATKATLEQRVTQRTVELQAKEARYRSLVTASAQIVWTTNPAGEVVEELPSWEGFTGQNRDEYTGSGWAQVVHPEDRERTRQIWSQAVETRSLYQTEYRLRHRDGQYRYVTVRGVPVIEENGAIREWVGTCTDITERKLAERRRDITSRLLALFAQKTSASGYLAAVVQVLRDWSGCQAVGIRVMNEQRQIAYESWSGFEPGFLALDHTLSQPGENCTCLQALSLNDEKMDRALLTPGGSYQCNDTGVLQNLVPIERQAQVRKTFAALDFSSIAVIPIRYRSQATGAIHLADRRPAQFPPGAVEVIENLTPLIGEAVHRFQAESELANYRDRLEELVQQRTVELQAANARLQVEITERRRAQEKLQQTAHELERSNRDLEQFAYVASHDLQEPLRAVGGYVGLLERRFPDLLDAKAHEYIAGAADGAARMERLITDLLAFSRVGTQGGVFAPADLNTSLSDALKNLQASIRATQARVSSEHLPTLTVDASQMAQLFQNLIGNAIKFRSEHPPQIQVGAQFAGERWVISVRDNGIGIESQYFERIFQIFQRLHTRAHYPGTGIGLAICKRIVERHGGSIWVESRLGQGATFLFSLPQLFPKSKLL